jgi:hypothetical protein
MNQNFFGFPVECDGVLTSCIDILNDLPRDRGNLWSLHANLATEFHTPYQGLCQKLGLSWERGAKRFYVTKNKLSELVAGLKAIGIDAAQNL